MAPGVAAGPGTRWVASRVRGASRLGPRQARQAGWVLAEGHPAALEWGKLVQPKLEAGLLPREFVDRYDVDMAKIKSLAD
jgi:hypothetical protein